jgi:hypothetical protein
LRAKPGELFSVLKHMVGGEHSDNRLRIVGGRSAHLPQLLGDAKAIVEIGDDDRRTKHGGAADQADDQLKGRTLADQGNELLGKLSRDSGHMRVPDPPHMITGRILVLIDFSVRTLPPTMNVLLPGDQMQDLGDVRWRVVDQTYPPSTLTNFGRRARADR